MSTSTAEPWTRAVGEDEVIRSLGQLLLASAREWGDREALAFPTERLSYRELAERSWEMARTLYAVGVRPRDRVGILMLNSPDTVSTLFGVSILGAVPVPINARYRPRETSYLVADAELAAIVVAGESDAHVDFAALLHEGIAGLASARDPLNLGLDGFPMLSTVIHLSDRDLPGMVTRQTYVPLRATADDGAIAEWCAAVPIREPAIVLYTSGTTANPRGALLSHEAFVRTWSRVGDAWRITGEDRFWDPLPMFHLAALGPLVFTIGRGALFISDTYFEPVRGLRQIEEERPTWLYPAYPPVMQALATQPTFTTTDLSSVRAYMTVGPAETLSHFQGYLPAAKQVTLYGLTEGGPVSFTRLDDDADGRIRTCGRPLPGVSVRVVDPEGGAPAARGGGAGEIQFRGFNSFSGYYGDPKKTMATISADGWVSTGDRGRFDEAGRLLFEGRIKEMMKVGGENVAPAEIEDLVATHPAVKLCQATGIPDDRLDEVPVVFVELKPGMAVTAEELIAYCRDGLASFKVPRIVRFIDEWPMSATKIQRFRLREALLAELGGESERREPAL